MFGNNVIRSGEIPLLLNSWMPANGSIHTALYAGLLWHARSHIASQYRMCWSRNKIYSTDWSWNKNVQRQHLKRWLILPMNNYIGNRQPCKCLRTIDDRNVISTPSLTINLTRHSISNHQTKNAEVDMWIQHKCCRIIELQSELRSLVLISMPHDIMVTSTLRMNVYDINTSVVMMRIPYEIASQST